MRYTIVSLSIVILGPAILSLTTIPCTSSFTVHLQLSGRRNHVSSCSHTTPTSTTTTTTTTTNMNTELKSTQVDTDLISYAAAGKASVDMNKYNLSLEQAASEWTAILSAKTSLQDEGIFLNPKNARDNFVDILSFTVLRDGGLGLLLTELAGGREDGLGITIVEGLVAGGNAQGTGILPGDSIVALAVNQPSNNSDDGNLPMQSLQEYTAVSTECLGYDKTVEAILSLPEPKSQHETVTVTIKRLRRKPKVMVNLQFPDSEVQPDTTLELFAGENLRRAMLTRGVKLNDALSRRFDSGGTGDCGAEGTCATCVVGITKGSELLSPMNVQEEQILAKKPRWRMACKAVVGYGMQEGEVTVQVNPRQWS